MAKTKKKSIKQVQADRLINENISVERFTAAMEALGIAVVVPGTLLPAVFQRGESRFFVQLDESEFVVGGFFA